jgi:hypothetical protein
MISEIVHKQGPPSKDPLNNTVIAYSWMRILGV